MKFIRIKHNDAMFNHSPFDYGLDYANRVVEFEWLRFCRRAMMEYWRDRFGICRFFIVDWWRLKLGLSTRWPPK